MTRFSQIPAQTRSILLMIAAVFAFTVLDLTAKSLTMRAGVMQTLWARYAGQTLIVFIIILPKLKSRLRTAYPKLQLLRALFMLGATTFFSSA
ncbi:MAG: hypothetical protein COB39_09715 [Marinosulfonomonas sp.]|nr:MAG: hypothetical protein COB39_09715 [Marinosulfonomonas sp.]